jgi:post-segregation antitoxin (ccd killing protein)
VKSGVRTTIYVPGDLLAIAHQLDMNVSAVCTAALKAEIERRAEELHAAVAAGRAAEEILERMNGMAEEVPG